LVATRVLLGERRLVIPAEYRVASLTLVQHSLEFALVTAADATPEQVGGSLGAADQHAQLAGAPEQCLEWCRAFEDESVASSIWAML
jgi:hypothetical protein